ncbi:hypothetical protein HPB47_003424, partial [Ixodes persulcatus]
EPGSAEDSSSEEDEPRASTSATKKRQSLWKACQSSPLSRVPDFQAVPDDVGKRADCTPYEYFQQYVTDEMYAMMAMAMNTKKVAETGKSLNTSAEEMKIFFGISVTMSCLGHPQIKMYWMKRMRVPLIANSMSRDRYFQHRMRLKVVNDLNITDEEKNQDRLWRVRPLIAEVLKGCHKLPREELASVDEQMIPFSGRTPLRQFLPRKPNPEGLKNFVLASPSGLILDFEIYQGKKSLLCPGSSGIAESAVLRLAQTLSPGTRLFFDRYFTSPATLDKLVEKDIAGTGTVMNNRLPKRVKLSSEGQLKARGRGTSEMWVRSDDQQIIVRWSDNKPVTLMSSVHGKEPEDTCRRWNAKEKRYIDVSRPHIVQVYNVNMGGVDMADRMISYYRIKARVKKWTIRVIFNMFDMALSNAWILYTKDMKTKQKKQKDVLKFLDFRFSVGEVLVTQGSQESTDESDADYCPPP